MHIWPYSPELTPSRVARETIGGIFDLMALARSKDDARLTQDDYSTLDKAAELLEEIAHD